MMAVLIGVCNCVILCPLDNPTGGFPAMGRKILSCFSKTGKKSAGSVGLLGYFNYRLHNLFQNR